MSRKRNGKHDPYESEREAERRRERLKKLSSYDPKKMQVRAPLGCVIFGVLIAIGICWMIFRMAFKVVY